MYVQNSTVATTTEDYFFDNSTEDDATYSCTWYTYYYYDDEKTDEILFFYLSLFVHFSGVLSLVTFSTALISCINIPEWRTFKNYIHFNITFSCIALYAIFIFAHYVTSSCDVSSIFYGNNFMLFVVDMFIETFNCWLFIASIVSYMNIVEVFTVATSRKILKCNLFAWGVPAIICMLFITLDFNYAGKNLYEDCHYYCEVYEIEMIVFYSILFIIYSLNFFAYLRVLYRLLTITRLGRRTYVNKLKIATFIFFMSGSMIFPAAIMFPIEVNYYLKDQKTDNVEASLPFYFVFAIQTIAINSCFLMLKNNNEKLYTFCCMKMKKMKFCYRSKPQNVASVKNYVVIHNQFKI